MARAVAAKDAKRIISEFSSVMSELSSVESETARLRSEIKESIQAILNAEAETILREIPIEELAKEKKGFKTKPLKDAGYTTLADINGIPPAKIGSIHGIGDDSAYVICNIVKSYTSKITHGIKLRISTDKKTEEKGKLLSLIMRYRGLLPLSKKCKQLYVSNRSRIEFTINDLKPATSGFTWLFKDADVKKKAEAAYGKLCALRESDFYKEAKEALFSVSLTGAVSPSQAWSDFSANSITYFNIIEEICPGILGNGDMLYGLPDELAAEIDKTEILTDGLTCTLRRYQEWGAKYVLHQGRALLGDEMGLGKTVQAIACMVSLKNAGGTHFAVVCPAGVLSNWCREITKHSNLSVIKIHGDGKDEALKNWVENGGVAVTTFETTPRFELAEGFRFSLLTVDEAHYIKNADTRRSTNVRRIAEYADRLLFMTGTALENNVDEMISLVEILQPAVARIIKSISFMSAAPQFREKIAPVYYRRRREDVLTELPELIQSQEWCELWPSEKKAYEQALRSNNFAQARRVSWNVGNLEVSSKAARLKEIVDEAALDGRKVIVFSFFLDTIASICEFLGDACVQPINGSVPPERRQEIIDEFEKREAGTVLPAQIQSGGTGLNIQTASVVVICEPQFKPSIENQAISRAYRMGQTRNVLVFRLLSENTVDERITELLEEKQAIFDAFADESEVAKESFEIDERSFRGIMESELQRVVDGESYA